MNLCLVIFAALVAAATAYEQYLGNARHPDHPGKCYHNSIDSAIPIGDEYRPIQTEVCAKYYCREDFVIRINHCPRFNVPGGCTPVGGDHSKPFPYCCAKLRCVDKDGNVQENLTYGEV